jgi:hypothetical protein
VALSPEYVGCTSIDTIATAGGGISPTNSPALDVNNELTIVTLSEDPAYSMEVIQAPQPYSYVVSTFPDDDMVMTYQIQSDTLTEDLSSMLSSMKEDFKKYQDIEITAGFPAYIIVYHNLVYDDITWEVRVAKSTDFIMP